MRSIFAVLLTLTVIAACGGGPAATGAVPTSSSQPTTTGQPSVLEPTVPTGSATPAQQPGGAGSVSVTLGGGEHAGTHNGSGETNCSYGVVGEGVWGVQYSVAELPADQLSSVQLVWREGEEGEGEMFSGVKMLVTIGFGDLLGDYTAYEVEVRSDGEESSGDGTVQITDSGSSAVIHATGTTPEGVTIDATINCPSVFRA